MAEIIVTSTADSGAGTLRQALADASDGDVILFDETVFPTGQTTTIYLSSSLSITAEVTINGGVSSVEKFVIRDVEGTPTEITVNEDNPAQTGEVVLFRVLCRVALDGQNAVRLLQITSDSVVINGVALKNAAPSSGYGGVANIASSRQLTLTNCAVDSCTSTGGGGVVFLQNSSSLVLTQCSISSCASPTGGAIYANTTTGVTASDCVFISCSSTSHGGVIRAESASVNTFSRCIFTDGSGVNGGAGYNINSSSTTLNNCTISGCTATSGGAFYNTGTATLALNNCNIVNCSTTSNGGAVRNAGGVIACSHCVFDSCSASTNHGGAFYSSISSGTAHNVFTDCDFTSCSARYGGAAAFTGVSDGSFTACRFTGCTATTSSGALRIAVSSQVSVSDCVFAGNSAPTAPSIYASDNTVVTITNSDLDNVYFGMAANIVVSDGVTSVATLTIVSNSVVVTISDGAALSITTSASVGSATISSPGRGYLALASGVSIGSAPLTNVVSCEYGAGITAFRAYKSGANAVLETTVENDNVPFLIESKSGDAWTTITTEGTPETTDPLAGRKVVEYRVFDGEAFWTNTAGVRSIWTVEAWGAFEWNVEAWAENLGGSSADQPAFSVKAWGVAPQIEHK